MTLIPLLGCSTENRADDPFLDSLPVYALASAASAEIGAVSGGGPEELFQVRDAEILLDGSVAILDGGSRELRVFGQDGRPLWVVGGEGDGPGEFRSVTWLRELPDGRLAIFDDAQLRLSIFRPDGSFLEGRRLEPTRIGAYPTFVLPILGDERLFNRDMPLTTGSSEEAFEVFSHPAVFSLIREDGLDTVAVIPGIESYAARRGGSITLGPLPLGRSAVYAAGSSFLIFGDGSTPAIFRIGVENQVEKLELPFPVLDLEEADWEQARRNFLKNVTGRTLSLRQMAWREMDRPTTRPSYDILLVDGSDRIWVRRFWIDGEQEWVVLSEDLEGIRTVLLPAAMRLMDADERTVLVLTRDSLGIEKISLWRTAPSGENRP